MSLGVERIAFLFVQHGAQDVGRNVDQLANKIDRVSTSASRMGANLLRNPAFTPMSMPGAPNFLKMPGMPSAVQPDYPWRPRFMKTSADMAAWFEKMAIAEDLASDKTARLMARYGQASRLISEENAHMAVGHMLASRSIAERNIQIAKSAEAAEKMAARFALAGTALSAVSTAVSAIGTAITTFGTIASEGIIGAIAIARLGESFAKLGGHMVASKQQFENTANTMGTISGEMLPKLRQATLGAVSDMDLMRLSNFALASGLKITEGEFTRLAEASTKLAIIHGREAPEALQRLTFGIVKMERRILDELGIVIRAKDVFKDYAASIGKTTEQLTAHEKVQGFLNATLQAAEEQTKSFAGVNFTLATVGDRLGTSFANFGQKLAAVFVESGNAEKLFKAVDHALGDILTRLSQPGQAEAFFGGLVTGAQAVIRLAEKMIGLLIDMVPLAERLLKAFLGFQVGSAVGNTVGSIVSLLPFPGAPLVGQGIKIAAPLVGAATGWFSGSDAPVKGAKEIGDAIEPRLQVTEDKVSEMASILRNSLLYNAPNYGASVA